MLKYENVTFLNGPARKMGREAFIAAHLGNYWRDKDEDTRRKMLGEAYDLITKGTRKGRGKK